MFIKNFIRYGYNDVMIQPAKVSTVEHRSDCNPFIDDKMLPIFAAPMSTVVNMYNYDTFYENHIYAIIPRNVEWHTRKTCMMSGNWVAVSLFEFENFICDASKFDDFDNLYHLRVLVDIANGNMDKMLILCKRAKGIHGDKIEIMAGNIANPYTYDLYCKNGIDYVRVGIGVGQGCITTSNTGIHDGIASLIDDIYLRKERIKKEGGFVTKIIADGGIRGYADVIKALALGADYVMIGGLMSQMVESAAPTYTYAVNKEKVYVKGIIRPCTGLEVGKWKDDCGNRYDKLYKEFYGMASKYGQIDINGEKTKTSEGIKKEVEVISNISTWVDNMSSYLRSAMSYCGIKDIKYFKPNRVNVQVISNNVKNSINK